MDRPFPWVCWDLYCDGLVYKVCGHLLPLLPNVRGTFAAGDRAFQQYIEHKALACVGKVVQLLLILLLSFEPEHRTPVSKAPVRQRRPPDHIARCLHQAGLSCQK